MSDEMDEPWVEIVNEPHKTSNRYRYGSERGNSGRINGEKPGVVTAEIHNLKSDAIVKVFCVSAEEPYYPHPHGLFGRNCEDGICTIRATRGNNVIKLNKVGIRCCRQKDVEESMKLRERTQYDPFRTGFQYDSRKISLNCIRLCFQVYLVDANQQLTKALRPVVTQEIFNQKSYRSLEIRRLSLSSAHARGGDELFILCDNVDKNDIRVRFFATLNDGTDWEGYGDFTPLDVHEKCAVVCKTPAFLSRFLLEPVSANVQLVQPSTETAGQPKQFHFIPNEEDIKDIINAKRLKLSSDVNAAHSSPISRLPFVEENHERQQSDGGFKGLADIVGIAPSSSSLGTSLPLNLPAESDLWINNSDGCFSNAQYDVNFSSNSNPNCVGTIASSSCLETNLPSNLPAEPHLWIENLISCFNNAQCDVNFSSNSLPSSDQLLESSALDQLLSELCNYPMG